MFDKKYTYRTGSGPGEAIYAADDLDGVAAQIVRDERAAGFGLGILHDRGVLEIVRSGLSRFQAMAALEEVVGRARQDYRAEIEAESGRAPWAYAPHEHRRDVITAASFEELAKKVSVWGVRTYIRVDGAPRDVFAAVDEVVNGRIFRDGKPVRFDEPLRDPDSRFELGRIFDSAVLLTTIIERAMLRCKVHVDEIERHMAEKVTRTVQYLVVVQERSGIVTSVVKDASDDEGERHAIVAVVDVGGGAVRRLGTARRRRESAAEHGARAQSLVGKEVEFGRSVDEGWRFDELPGSAKGLSAAARERYGDEPALAR
jgi:hypothetical protein